MPVFPLFIFGILESLGLGEQLFVAAVLAFVAWEAYRVIAMGKKAGGFMGSIGFYAILIFAAASLAIALGWVDPNPDVVIGHISAAIDAVSSWAADQLTGLY